MLAFLEGSHLIRVKGKGKKKGATTMSLDAFLAADDEESTNWADVEQDGGFLTTSTLALSNNFF